MIEISKIPLIPDDIKRAAADGRLVLFIGAGVSRIVGGPSWKELALRYLKYLYDKKVINYCEYEYISNLEPRKILSVCEIILNENKIEPPDINDFIKLKSESDKIKILYNAICDFNCIYVTTNYDDNLDKIIEERNDQSKYLVNQKGKIVYSPEDVLVSELNNLTVIHIHGSPKDRNNMIITIKDYINHYQKGNKIPEFLKEIFSFYTIVFIGYGLEEFEILELLISKSQDGKSIQKEVKHFMLYPIFSKDMGLLKYQEKYYIDLGIKLLPYPIDENGYEHLINVVSEWAKQIGPISRPPNFINKVKIIDEVV